MELAEHTTQAFHGVLGKSIELIIISVLTKAFSLPESIRDFTLPCRDGTLKLTQAEKMALIPKGKSGTLGSVSDWAALLKAINHDGDDSIIPLLTLDQINLVEWYGIERLATYARYSLAEIAESKEGMTECIKWLSRCKATRRIFGGHNEFLSGLTRHFRNELESFENQEKMEGQKKTEGQDKAEGQKKEAGGQVKMEGENLNSGLSE